VLVLTRRLEESIVIGGNIVVTVLSVEGEKVKLGIDAPRDVPILRRELYNAIQQQEAAAQKLAGCPSSAAVDELRGALAGEEDPVEADPGAASV
jgi:carbon storage regulator